MASSTPSSIPPPSSESAPAVRARHPQTLLRLTRASAPVPYRNIAAALGEKLAAIEAATPMAWLPIELDVAVVEAIAERLGPSTTASLIEARQREEMGSALFDGFVKMTLRVFGASPLVLVKRIPPGWQQLFRCCGTIDVVSTGAKQAEMRLRGVPAPCIGSAAWMAALPVGLGMLYELVGAKGTVTCRIEDASQGIALLTFAWS